MTSDQQEKENFHLHFVQIEFKYGEHSVSENKALKT